MTLGMLPVCLNPNLHIIQNGCSKNYFVGSSWWLNELCLAKHVVQCLSYNWLQWTVAVVAISCYSCILVFLFAFCLFLKGLLFSSVECVKSPQDLVKLYLHESNRVYRDKMVEEKDFDLFDKIQTEVVKKIFDVSIALWIFLLLKNNVNYADDCPNDKI